MLPYGIIIIQCCRSATCVTWSAALLLVYRAAVEDGTLGAVAHCDDVSTVFALLSLSSEEQTEMSALIRRHGQLVLVPEVRLSRVSRCKLTALLHHMHYK